MHLVGKLWNVAKVQDVLSIDVPSFLCSVVQVLRITFSDEELKPGRIVSRRTDARGSVDWARRSKPLKADSHIPCRSPATPFREGFRLCLSHLIYTVRSCLIHTYHAVPMPCRSAKGLGCVFPI
jgi:hypothetical protein